MRDRKDFINIRLTASVLQLLGEATSLRIVNGRMNYAFVGAAPVEVLRSEWTHLRKESNLSGEPLFEEATSITAATPAAEGEDTDA